MVLIWVLVLVRRLAHSVFRSEPEFTTTSKNPSPVFLPAQTSTYTYLGVLRRSPTLPKWLEVLDHAALTRWRSGVRVPTSLPFKSHQCLRGCSRVALSTRAYDPGESVALIWHKFQFAFAVCGVRQASTDILICQIGKFAQDILMAHPARQVFEHIIDGDAKSWDAWLPSALSRLQSDDLGVVHSPIIAGLARAFSRSGVRVPTSLPFIAITCG
jgi:hypothetical protein